MRVVIHRKLLLGPGHDRDGVRNHVVIRVFDPRVLGVAATYGLRVYPPVIPRIVPLVARGGAPAKSGHC